MKIKLRDWIKKTRREIKKIRKQCGLSDGDLLLAVNDSAVCDCEKMGCTSKEGKNG